MIALLVLVGCWTPKETGPTGMVGHVLDPGGIPVKGLDVSTLEEHVVTDDDGTFAIQYKPPDQLVHFQWKGAWYHRDYRPEDDHRIVDVKLPWLRDAHLDCSLPQPCDLDLAWDLGDGLFAEATAKCDPGHPASLQQIPKAPVTVTCRGADKGSYVVEDPGADVIRVGPPPIPVRVQIRGDEGEAPQSCVVTVGDRVAQPSGEGFWSAEANGTVLVAATCDGRPAVPKTITVAPDAEVALDWSPTGPTLDVAGAVPAASDLWLVAEGSPERPGWSLHVQAADDGSFALPPLAEGVYRVAVGDPGLLATVPLPKDPTEPGVLRILAVTPGGPGSPGSAAGVLRVEEDLTEGRIPVAGLQ